MHKTYHNEKIGKRNIHRIYINVYNECLDELFQLNRDQFTEHLPDLIEFKIRKSMKLDVHFLQFFFSNCYNDDELIQILTSLKYKFLG